MLQELTEAEAAFKAQQAAGKEALRAAIVRIVQSCATESARAQAAHKLYWGTSIPPGVLAECFNLKAGSTMHLLAGPKTEIFRCASCQQPAPFSFTTRTAWAEATNPRAGSRPLTCQTCWAAYWQAAAESSRTREEEYRQARQAEGQAEAERLAALAKLPWELFIETEDWIAFRNKLLDSLNYRCQFCGVEDSRLHLHLHIAMAGHTAAELASPDAIFFLYCDADANRCADLINPLKGEVIKQEWLPGIVRWNRERGDRYE